MRSDLLKDSIIYTLGSFLTRAFSFLLIPVYTRFLSVEEYGTLALLQVILLLVSFVCLLGISTASMRFYFDPHANEDYRKRIYGTSLILLLVFPAIIFSLITPLCYILIKRFVPTVPFFPYVFIILILGIFDPIQKLVLGLMRVQKRAKTYVLYTMSSFFVQTSLTIFMVTGLKLRLKGVVYSQLIVFILFWLIGFVIIKKYAKFNFSWKMAKRLLFFGIPLLPSFIFIWMDSASGRLLLERFASLKDLGIFALAAQFSGILLLLSTALDNSVLPYFFETARRTEASQALGRFSSKYFVFFSIISLFLFAVAQPLVILMAAPKFHEAAKYIPLLILAGWMNIIFKLFHWNLMYAKRTATVSTLTGIFSLLMIGLLVIVLKIYGWGIQGLVMVTVLASLLKCLMGYFVSQHYFRIKYKLKEIGLISLVMGAGVVIIQLPIFPKNFILVALFKLSFFAIGTVLVLKIAAVDIFKRLAEVKWGEKTAFSDLFNWISGKG